MQIFIQHFKQSQQRPKKLSQPTIENIAENYANSYETFMQNSTKVSATASFDSSNFPRKEDKENWLAFAPMFPNMHTASHFKRQADQTFQTDKTPATKKEGKAVCIQNETTPRPLSKNTKHPLRCQSATTGMKQITCCGLLLCRTILLQIAANRCMGLPPNNQQTKRKFKPFHELQ